MTTTEYTREQVHAEVKAVDGAVLRAHLISEGVIADKDEASPLSWEDAARMSDAQLAGMYADFLFDCYSDEEDALLGNVIADLMNASVSR